MANVIELSDLSAPELRVYTKLTDAQLKTQDEQLFIAESEKVIRLALQLGYKPVSLMMERRQITGLAADIVSQCGDIPIYTADRDTLASITGFPLTRGFLGVFRRPKALTVDEILPRAERVCVLEGITDVTNMGAIFRSAAALNMDAVLLSPSCCDPLYRRSVRVSMGTVLQIPWARFPDWPNDGIKQLHNYGFKTAAMALSDNSVGIDAPVLTDEKKLAIILGTEGDGLTSETIAMCDYTVKIPMAHGVDSLNVAAASAVAFWELRRK